MADCCTETQISDITVTEPKMGWLQVFLCVWFACYIGDSYAARKKKMTEIAYLDLLESCPGIPGSRSFLNSSFEYRGKDDFRINIYAVFNSSYDKVSVTHDISICPSKEMESCQKFLYFDLEDFCELTIKNGFWNMLLNAFVPPISCPLQGTYTLKDYPVTEITPAVMKFLGILQATSSDFYYDRFILKQGQENILCMDVRAAFRLLRTKQPRQ